MEKEIYNKGEDLTDTLQQSLDVEHNRVTLKSLNLPAAARIRRVTILACGTSYYASIVGKHYIERIARIPVGIDYASEYRYRRPLVRGRGRGGVSPRAARPRTRWLRWNWPKKPVRSPPPSSTWRAAEITRVCDGVIGMQAGPGDRRRQRQGLHQRRWWTCCCSPPIWARRRGAWMRSNAAELIASVAGAARHGPRPAAGGTRNRAVMSSCQKLPSEPQLPLSGRGGHQLRRSPARGRPQAQGSQLHPRRGLSRRRDEARTHRPHRQGFADELAVPPHDSVYDKMVSQVEAGRGRERGQVRLPSRARATTTWRRPPTMCCPSRNARAFHPAHPGRAAVAVVRLRDRVAQGAGRRPTAQPGKERDCGISAVKSAADVASPILRHRSWATSRVHGHAECQGVFCHADR